MKKRIAFMLVLLILLGLTGCKKEPESDTKTAPELLEPVGVQMDIAQAQIGEIYKLVTYNGAMVPYVEELQFQVDGNLEEVKVSLGEQVAAGQVLVCLSEEEVISRMEELEEEIADIEKTGEFTDRQMTATIEIAKIELEQLEKNGASGKSVRLKEVDVRKLENELEQVRELRQLELQEKQREWNALKEKTGNNEIVAPFDGRVVYIRDVNNGDAIQGYTTIMCLADESRLCLETEFISGHVIESSYSIYAKIGEKEYNVEYVPYYMSDYIAKVLTGEEIKTQFLVEAEEGELESGLFAVVMVMSNYKENVLTVPVNALYQDRGGYYVYKLTDGKRIRCDVSVGIVNGTKAEITAGLEEGDFVYVKE